MTTPFPSSRSYARSPSDGGACGTPTLELLVAHPGRWRFADDEVAGRGSPSKWQTQQLTTARAGDAASFTTQSSSVRMSMGMTTTRSMSCGDELEVRKRGRPSGQRRCPAHRAPGRVDIGVDVGIGGRGRRARTRTRQWGRAPSGDTDENTEATCPRSIGTRLPGLPPGTTEDRYPRSEPHHHLDVRGLGHPRRAATRRLRGSRRAARHRGRAWRRRTRRKRSSAAPRAGSLDRPRRRGGAADSSAIASARGRQPRERLVCRRRRRTPPAPAPGSRVGSHHRPAIGQSRA